MFPKHISALALLLLFATAVPAQTDKTDDFLNAEMQRQNIPGLSETRISWWRRTGYSDEVRTIRG